MGEVINRLDPVPPPGRREVRARLISPTGWFTDDADLPAEVVTGWATTVADNGAWSLVLPPNSSFDAPDTWYQVTEPGARHACVIPAGDGPYRLRDIEITDPGAPPCCPPPAAGDIGARVLDDLDDVSGATAAAPGQTLIKQVAGGWQPADIAGGGALAGQVKLTALAAEDLSGHRIVTPRTTGSVKYASASDGEIIHAPLWLTLGAALAGDPVELLLFGPTVESSWLWVPGPVFLGDDGLLTQLPPTSASAVFLAQVGTATAATRMVVDRQPSIVLS